MELKVFENDVTEWVIAESPEEATRIAIQVYGNVYDDDVEWVECPLDREWTRHDEVGGPVTKTFREWIESEGKCFLGTTEY